MKEVEAYYAASAVASAAASTAACAVAAVAASAGHTIPMNTPAAAEGLFISISYYLLFSDTNNAFMSSQLKSVATTAYATISVLAW